MFLMKNYALKLAYILEPHFNKTVYLFHSKQLWKHSEKLQDSIQIAFQKLDDFLLYISMKYVTTKVGTSINTVNKKTK